MVNATIGRYPLGGRTSLNLAAETGSTDMSNVIDHPAAALMAEVKVERDIADAPEAQALQEAILYGRKSLFRLS